MRHMKTVAMAIAGLCIAACSQLVPYKPLPLSSGDPLRVVEQVLKEQPGEWAPVNLVIDPQHFELKRNRRVPVSVYYTSVKDVEIYRKGGVYRLRIIDKAGQVRITIMTYQEEQAYRFVDAINQLAANAS